MRILIFLDTDHLSGPARLALDFAVEARRRGHEILLLGLIRDPAFDPAAAPNPSTSAASASFPSAPDNAFTRAWRAAGFEPRVLRERKRFDRDILRQFKALIAEFKPDVFQSHGYKGSMLGRHAQRAGVPWQAMFHGFTWENWLVRLYHWLDVRWMRGADEVIAVSKPFRTTLGARGIPAARLRWIPNAIDAAALAKTASGEPLRTLWREGLPQDAVIAGVIGRFSPEKATDHFLKSFKVASEAASNLHAVMVGDGPEFEASKALATELKLNDRVRFAGFRTDLATIYEALDMLVIPSRSEGLPTVLLEAMLLKVPVVSTRVGGVPDLVEEGKTALLAPIEDVPALGQAMARLASDAALRQHLAADANALATSQLTVERRTQLILDHAQCLIDRKPLPAD